MAAPRRAHVPPPPADLPGPRLDPARNAERGPLISRDGSKLAAWVVPTDEERVIARHARDTLVMAATG